MSVEQLTNMCINLVVLEIICSVKSQDYLHSPIIICVFIYVTILNYILNKNTHNNLILLINTIMKIYY